MPIVLPDPDKPVFLADVDGVFCNIIDGALNVLRQVPGYENHTFTHDDVTTYKMEECLGLPTAAAERWLQLWSRPGFCAGLPPYPEAVEAIAELKEIANVYPVTAPWASPTWTAERDWWLKEHFGIDRAWVSHSEQKWMFDGHFLIDDKAANLKPWALRRPKATPILWKQCYNEHEWKTLLAHHTRSWNDVIAIVKMWRP